MSESNFKFRFRDSISFKLLIIGGLILLLLIPSVMVESLIKERMHRKNAVMDEITLAWSHSQTLTGPILSLPYNDYYKNKDGETRSRVKTAYILPESLKINGKLKPEVRYRSIYKAVVYGSDLKLSGTFDFSVLKQLHIRRKDVRLHEAELIMGITDIRGITDSIELLATQEKANFNSGESESQGGGRVTHIIASSQPKANDDGFTEINLHPGSDLGFGANVRSSLDLNNLRRKMDFSLSLNLNGSKSLSIIPVGKTTIARLESDWSDPSFFGSFLPDTRDVSEKGFTATWKVLHLNRPFPQAWKNNNIPNLQRTAFGANLIITNDKYQKVSRTEKYGLMFIVFTFLAFFMSEIVNKIKVHPIQYLFIGMGLIVFYSLLLSFSEHITFNKSYMLSAFATVSMITSYSRSVLRKNKLAMFVGLILTILYLYLFVLLHMQDFALLLGSIGLFSVLAIVMYLTRNIDWYGENRQQDNF
ncbi:MAG: cell envelope integrity protein CreD [Gammaproteobacteria bacterium]|nr:cell envelope integrity protein CreD [Gammaproteobacteria bacterium]NNM13093.1 cell envelope integrity protein CreD [Gammaproteobacteria bacterium]